jgi:hypothetical protein
MMMKKKKLLQGLLEIEYFLLYNSLNKHDKMQQCTPFIPQLLFGQLMVRSYFPILTEEKSGCIYKWYKPTLIYRPMQLYKNNRK